MLLKHIVVALALTSIISGSVLSSQGADYSNDMKMPVSSVLTTNEGAASVDRQFDHKNSPYFKHPDFYHMKSNKTLTMLTGFRTLQQSSEWSCGPAAALMVLDWYGKAGNYTEESLAAFRHQPADVHVAAFSAGYPGTTLKQMEDIWNKVDGFTWEDTLSYIKEGKALTPESIQQELKAGHPILVCWIDWGGHWQVIIGYDNMGTKNTLDDVIIVADSYDVTDHNQDGYGIYPASRFFSTFDMYGQFPSSEGGSQGLFLIPVPKK